MLDQLAPKGAGIYISSRVSQEKVAKEIPWTRFGSQAGGQPGDFRDMRLGSPSTFVENILRAVAPKGKSGPSVVVLDTWDGIAKEMDEVDRLKAEKMLIAAADSAKSRLIFVSEEPQRSTMDYLVDGIVELRRGEESGRVIREIEIEKLRGTRIDYHKYLYTLEGGRFNPIPPYLAPDYSVAKSFKTIHDGGDYFSFGSPRLDEVFKGLRKGATTAVVYDEKVPYSAIRLLTISAEINALNTGKGVFVVGLPGAANDEVALVIKNFVDEERFLKCFAVGSVGGGMDLKPPLHPVPGDEPRRTSARVNEIIQRVRDNSEAKSVLVIESVGTFESSYATRIEGVLEGTGRRSGSVRATGTDTLLLLIQRQSLIRSQILALSGTYVELTMKDRSVVITGEKPGTPAYALNHQDGNPLLSSLTLIV